MARLLAYLFAMMLLLAATSEVVEVRICRPMTSCGKETAACLPFEKNDCGKKSGCPLSCCFICMPGCCQYLVPEQPWLHLRLPAAALTARPAGQQECAPQSVDFAIWHPPSATV